MKVYLDREYRHRRPSALFAAVVLIGMGVFILWSCIGIFSKDESLGLNAETLVMLLPLGGALLFIYAGSTQAYGWLTNRIDRQCITEEGIRNFGKFTAWNEIRCVFCGCKKKGELSIFYQKKRIGIDRCLPTTPPLPNAEIEALLQELKIDLGPIYKELKFGQTARLEIHSTVHPVRLESVMTTP